jgi:hypothetical protein
MTNIPTCYQALTCDILIDVRPTAAGKWRVTVVDGCETDPRFCFWDHDAAFAEADTCDEAKRKGEAFAREVGGAELRFVWQPER